MQHGCTAPGPYTETHVTLGASPTFLVYLCPGLRHLASMRCTSEHHWQALLQRNAVAISTSTSFDRSVASQYSTTARLPRVLCTQPKHPSFQVTLAASCSFQRIPSVGRAVCVGIGGPGTLRWPLSLGSSDKKTNRCRTDLSDQVSDRHFAALSDRVCGYMRMDELRALSARHCCSRALRCCDCGRVLRASQLDATCSLCNATETLRSSSLRTFEQKSLP